MNTTVTSFPEPLLLTRAEVAHLLATSDRHVRRLIEDGRLPSVRLGGKVRVHREQLDDFVVRLCRQGDVEVDLSGPSDAPTDQWPPRPGGVAPLPVIDN